VVGHSYNPSPREAEAGRSQVLGQPGLCSETLSLKTLLPSLNKKFKKISVTSLTLFVYLGLELLLPFFVCVSLFLFFVQGLNPGPHEY
jgi:hypothetical protein